MPVRALIIGFPKSGTSTIQTTFEKAGLKAVHWRVGDVYVGQKIYESHFAGRNPLEHFLDYDAITQTDVCLPGAGLNYWPQLDLAVLAAIRRHNPDCVFILNRREPKAVARSIANWGDFQTRLVVSEIPGLPMGYGRTAEELMIWIEAHHDAVKRYFAADPKFLDLDILAPDARERLAAAIGVELTWWGRSNANPVVEGPSGTVAKRTGSLKPMPKWITELSRKDVIHRIRRTGRRATRSPQTKTA